MSKAFGAAFLIAATAGTFASRARADQRDPAAAQALFDEARTLMKSKRFEEACPKLTESQRLDPGIGTEFRLADCYEQQGKIASAWAGFLDVASVAAASGQADREKAARARAAHLESRLPKLTIVVPPANRAPGLEIKRDGAAIGEAQWGSAVPVDPGDYQIVVGAPGKREFTGQVSVREGAPATFNVPLLESVPASEAATPVPVIAPVAAAIPPAAPAPTTPEPKDTPSTGSSGPGVLVITVGAVGIVGVALGTTFGLMASSKYDESKKHCRDSNENLCDQQGIDLRDKAFTFGNVATASFIVGGVALASAATLWIVNSGSESSAPHAGLVKSLRAGMRAGPERGTFVVEGRF
jgi:tetratricopeptide (TPR) repeat protein